ncbi:MAG TPA: efflux RND transporter periplasmic adaptor subunit [Gemmatimonadaceae bacterium]|nr:efflux RND transporter periplasmic adaptor subunit [Gemmatimonadaceae bacterium]
MQITRTRIIILATILAAAALAAYAMRPKPLVVDAAPVARGPLEATVEADGKTRVRERYVVVAPVAGRLARIELLEGTSVRPGQIIARLTPLPLDSQSLVQAQARIDAANALALDAAAQVRLTRAALDQQHRDLSRAQRLAEVGGVAPRVVEESELAVTQADAAYRSAIQRAEAADADARQARAALIGQRDGRAAMLLVRAPAAGRVLRVPERSERIVAAGTAIMEIGDPGSLEIVVDVLSSDGAVVHPGDRVRLTEWGGSNGEQASALLGRVREIEPSGFTKVSALGVDEQRVNVIVDVDSIPPGIGDGFRVDASIIVWSAPSVVVVPRSAIVQQGAAGWSVFVVRDGRTQTRTVRIGHVGGAGAEVVNGLAAGDVVVLFPSDQVRAGVRVKARQS